MEEDILSQTLIAMNNTSLHNIALQLVFSVNKAFGYGVQRNARKANTSVRANQ